MVKQQHVKLIKEYYPDAMVQIGVIVLAFNARTTCTSSMFYGYDCSTDWIAVLVIMFISVGANIIVRRFLSVAYDLQNNKGDKQ